MDRWDFRNYIPALLCFAFLMLGLGTGYLGIVLSVAWAYVAVKVVNHYILKKKPENQK